MSCENSVGRGTLHCQKREKQLKQICRVSQMYRIQQETEQAIKSTNRSFWYVSTISFTLTSSSTRHFITCILTNCTIHHFFTPGLKLT